MRIVVCVIGPLIGGLLIGGLSGSPNGATPAAYAQGTPTAATAGQGESSPEQASDEAPGSFLEIVFAGGLTGFLIMLLLFALSIGAATLVIEHLLTIREAVLIPEGLGQRVRDQLTAGSLSGADQACQGQPSFLSFVLRAGFSEADGGWSAVEKAMEDATAEQAARLFRKIEFLSVIGNIAPMVGLLGTVTGMIFAFQEVADSQGAARAAELAEGIYQALVTTVGGLLVAIPSLAAYAVFRNRVDQLVAEAAYAAQHASAPLKRLRSRRNNPAPPPSQGGA